MQYVYIVLVKDGVTTRNINIHKYHIFELGMPPSQYTP